MDRDIAMFFLGNGIEPNNFKTAELSGLVIALNQGEEGYFLITGREDEEIELRVGGEDPHFVSDVGVSLGVAHKISGFSSHSIRINRGFGIYSPSERQDHLKADSSFLEQGNLPLQASLENGGLEATTTGGRTMHIVPSGGVSVEYFTGEKIGYTSVAKRLEEEILGIAPGKITRVTEHLLGGEIRPGIMRFEVRPGRFIDIVLMRDKVRAGVVFYPRPLGYHGEELSLHGLRDYLSSGSYHDNIASWDVGYMWGTCSYQESGRILKCNLGEVLTVVERLRSYSFADALRAREREVIAAREYEPAPR